MNECIYCKSTDIEKELPVIAKEYGSTTPGMIGPYFLKEAKKFLGQTQYHCSHAPTYADLCKQCGSIRMYVKDPNRDWQKEWPSNAHPVIWKPLNS